MPMCSARMNVVSYSSWQSATEGGAWASLQKEDLAVPRTISSWGSRGDVLLPGIRADKGWL